LTPVPISYSEFVAGKIRQLHYHQSISHRQKVQHLIQHAISDDNE
jgi:hypothetical protein